MRQILQNWIQARLGIMIDLAPEIFGYYTKDGKLLAEILHSYDIINRDQLNTLLDTHDPALCRVNLKHLRAWLRFLGVECSNESMEEISCGKGTTSLRLFYKVYLCLESKDRLHFVTLQKEREKFVPDSKKFEVTKVSEDPPPYVTPNHPLSRKLIEGKDTIDWHRSKFPTLLRRFERVKETLRDCGTYTLNVVEPVEGPCDVQKPKPVSKTVEIEESEELDRFARKYRCKKKTLEEEQQAAEERRTQPVPEDPEMAKAYVDWLKCRTKQTATMDVLKRKMQKSLLADLWERIAEEQEEAFDKAIAGRVLDQSRYEKQIVTKLCEVREQKSIMADNQKLVENMTLQTNETEYIASLEREKDLASKARKDVDVECKRMCELLRRLRDKKIEMIKKKHWNLCYETAEDLVDLSLQMASYREKNNEDASSLILREWQALFLRCQPIFDEYASLEGDLGVDDDAEKKNLLEEAAEVNLEKMEELQDVLLVDYLEQNPPWNEYSLPVVEDRHESFELGHTVLGYVAHRILNYLRTDPAEKARAFSEKFHRAAIILGIVNPTARAMIKTLLEKNYIELVRMEDAINYCLERYKEEMLDGEFIDLTTIMATEDTVDELRRRAHSMKSGMLQNRKRPVSGRGSPRRNKSVKESRKKPEKVAKTIEKSELMDDKETQTPRNIPYDDLDPVLTDCAYIGKWAYEYLTIGEPITNELAVKILTEYLKTLSLATGWALMDYPTTYEQMALLEEALTGSKFPPNPDSPDFEDVTIEDVESITPRIVYEEIVDPSMVYRQSRIVPDPFKQTEDVSTSRFVNVFVRVVQKPKTFEGGDRLYETLQPETPAVDKFYSSQNVAYLLYYSSLDLTALKVLARLVIGEPLQSRPSEELFGSIFEADHAAERSVGSKAPIVRRLLVAEPSEKNSEGEEEEDQDSDRFDFSTELPIEMELHLIRPGEKDWEWIQFPLPATLAVYLSSLWSSMERGYVSSLKELLLLKSVHMSGTITYKNFLTKAAAEYIDRPHNKQDLLHKFHKAFNKIDRDARNDVDVKCELHRRIADFQTQLWEISDRRRDEVERERRRFVEYHWTVFQASILYNFYVAIIQIEMDRCADTMRMLHDYYLGMLRRPLLETPRTKIVLNKMKDFDVSPSKSELAKHAENFTAKRETTADKSKGRAGSMKSIASTPPSAPPAAPDYDVLQKEICDLLIDRSKSSEDAEGVYVLKAITENIRYAKSIVDGIAARASENLAREEAAASKSRDYAIDLLDPNDPKRLASRLQDLFLEWRYGIGYELARVRSRLDSFIAASRSDMLFLLNTMQTTYHKIYDRSIDRYWREMKSVNEMANVFCLAIEEAKPLEKEMLLDGDRFIVRSNVFVVPTYWEEEEQTELKEADSDSRFRVIQVSRLIEIFRRVAPHGTIAERAFVYILHDLASQGMEEGESLSLPCCWYRLRQQDISDLVRDLFQSADYIDWREFLIYALELPMPTTQELLIARDRFRIQDPELTEMISRPQFLRTPLWFFDSVEMFFDTHEFLRDDFHKNVEDLYEDELHQHDPEESVDALKIGSSVFSLPGCEQGSEKLRLILAKELLGRAYTVGRGTINYTAMLLAFCKDENPQEGFGKALALALGSRVCTDFEEGENYVEGFYTQARLIREAQFLQENFDAETLEVAKGVLDNLMDRIDETIMEVTTESSGELQPQSTSPSISLYSNEKTSSFFSSTGEEECDDSSKEQELIIYWLPLNVCLTVLTAALSCYTMKPNLFGKSSNLRENLTMIYRDLRDDTLNAEKNVTLVHRLLKHDLMQQLLNSTSKFIQKTVSSTINDILRSLGGTKLD